MALPQLLACVPEPAPGRGQGQRRSHRDVGDGRGCRKPKYTSPTLASRRSKGVPPASTGCPVIKKNTCVPTDKWSETFDDPEQFLIRRAAAYQAFYEHMPVRPIVSQRSVDANL